MRQDPYKVIVWAPGYLGSAVIKEVLKRPEFELVGVLAYSDRKNGMDVGEMLGIEPVGVRMTTDQQALEKFLNSLAGEIVAIGALRLAPFAVAHDAAEPLQYVFGDGDRRLGVLTDVGAPDEQTIDALAGVDALLLECNHDVGMLRASAYPPFLKSRILGAHGHLSNEQAAALLGQLDRRRLGLVAAGHLSRRNNQPRLAQQALAAVLGCAGGDVLVADQDDGLPWQRL